MDVLYTRLSLIPGPLRRVIDIPIFLSRQPHHPSKFHHFFFLFSMERVRRILRSNMLKPPTSSLWWYHQNIITRTRRVIHVHIKMTVPKETHYCFSTRSFVQFLLVNAARYNFINKTNSGYFWTTHNKTTQLSLLMRSLELQDRSLSFLPPHSPSLSTLSDIPL